MIHSRLLQHARERPEHPALIYGEETITYALLARKVEAAAGFMAAQGVAPGDRVVLSASSADPAFVYGYLACRRLGAIAVPIETKIARAHREAIVADAAPRLVFLEHEAPSARPTLPLSALDAPEKTPAAAEAAEGEVADILYTSGSTGRQKGVIQTCRGIASFARGRRAALETGPDDRLVIPVPLSHGYGLCRLRATLLEGATAIIVPGFLFARAVLSAIERHQATGLCCVPSGFAALFQLSGDALGAQGGSLRYVETATAPLHAAQRRRLLSLLPRARLFNTYGMTETTSTTAYHLIRDDSEPEGMVGGLIAGMQARVVDAEGRDLPAGEAGELLLRGDSLMQGYWNLPEATGEALREGWLRTSDVAWLDAAGRLHLKGRGDDLINIAGFKIAPSEVEGALLEHPAIQEAACIAIRDPDGFSGEAIKAFLVSKPGQARPSPADLAHFLAGKLEHHKIPSIFAWVDELPKGVSGKLLRRLLRAARLAS